MKILHKYAKKINLFPARNGNVYSLYHTAQEERGEGSQGATGQMPSKRESFFCAVGINVFVNRGGDHLLVAISQCPLCVTSHLYPELLPFLLDPSSSLEIHLALLYTPEGKRRGVGVREGIGGGGSKGTNFQLSDK